MIHAPASASAWSSGYAFEHRVVAEVMLNRPLASDETIHHRNGNRADNRPENLELWVSSQPAGQRVDDLIAWAKALLSRYEPSALVVWTADGEVVGS